MILRSTHIILIGHFFTIVNSLSSKLIGFKDTYLVTVISGRINNTEAKKSCRGRKNNLKDAENKKASVPGLITRDKIILLLALFDNKFLKNSGSLGEI